MLVFLEHPDQPGGEELFYDLKLSALKDGNCVIAAEKTRSLTVSFSSCIAQLWDVSIIPPESRNSSSNSVV